MNNVVVDMKVVDVKLLTKQAFSRCKNCNAVHFLFLS